MYCHHLGHCFGVVLPHCNQPKYNYPKNPDPLKTGYFEDPDLCYTGSNPFHWRVQGFLGYKAKIAPKEQVWFFSLVDSIAMLGRCLTWGQRQKHSGKIQLLLYSTSLIRGTFLSFNGMNPMKSGNVSLLQHFEEL